MFFTVLTRYDLKVASNIFMSSKRTKTKYVGVYYRIADSRRGLDGKLDRCYEILYKKKGKNIWEKIGWKSEGYTAEDAVRIRGQRVKAIRHPELGKGYDPSITVGQLWDQLQSVWLDMQSASYQRDIKCIYTLHIKKIFANKEVREIDYFDIEKFKKYLLKDYISEKTGRNISRRTIQYTLSIFRLILNKGKEFRISENRNDLNFSIPKNDNRRERYLSKKEAFQILESLKYISCNIYYITKIALYTGMRRNEVLYLKKENINFSTSTIAIDGKTGRRTVYIPDCIINQLKKITPKENDYIFKSSRGGVISESSIYKTFEYVVDSLGLNEGITDRRLKVVFYTLRHTFCSWLAIKGVPLYTISKLAGHASIEMTERYAKLSSQAQHEALKLIDDED